MPAAVHANVVRPGNLTCTRLSAQYLMALPSAKQSTFHVFTFGLQVSLSMVRRNPVCRLGF